MKRLLQIVSITAVLLFGLFLLLAFTNTTAQPVKTVYTPNQLLAEANKLRAEKGVPPLVLDERLNQSAQWKADDMVKTGVNHVSSDGALGHLKINVYAPKVCKYISENIASNPKFDNPYDKVDGWPTSVKHYEAILDTKYELTGFGIKVIDNNIYYVQHFCDLK